MFSCYTCILWLHSQKKLSLFGACFIYDLPWKAQWLGFTHSVFILHVHVWQHTHSILLVSCFLLQSFSHFVYTFLSLILNWGSCRLVEGNRTKSHCRKMKSKGLLLLLIYSFLHTNTFFFLSPLLYSAASSSLSAWIVEVVRWLHHSPLPPVWTLLILLQYWRQLFNKAGVSLALSALFSFRRAAVEIMCAPQIFMEDPRSPRFHFSSEREGDEFSKCRTYENTATDFSLWVTILDFLVVNKGLIMNQAVVAQGDHVLTNNCILQQEAKGLPSYKRAKWGFMFFYLFIYF